MARVEFYFGIGSRYSYLATARVAEIEAQSGVLVQWRVVYSPDLIERAGHDPFEQAALRGQYRSAYRSRDVARWADLLGIAYREPDFAAVDWRKLALWAAAAEELGGGPIFARAVFTASFAEGRPPHSPEDFASLAADAGLDPHALARRVDGGEAGRVLERNLTEALAAGCFGVPSFVTDDGEVFWGQDRIVLLLHHLKRPG